VLQLLLVRLMAAGRPRQKDQLLSSLPALSLAKSRPWRPLWRVAFAPQAMRRVRLPLLEFAVRLRSELLSIREGTSSNTPPRQVTTKLPTH
jgi:hypothetical protein